MTVTTHSDLAMWNGALLLAPSAVAVLGSALAWRATTMASAWRRARSASLVMLALAAAVAIVRVFSEDGAGGLLRADTPGVAMLALVMFVGWIVIGYSTAYIAGDPHERRYVCRMMNTLAAVGVVTVANNLLLLTLAWAATSVAMHGLLTFFGDRPVALAVAHKKFLLARCADSCMLGAVIALGTSFDTVRLDEITSTAVTAGSLPAGGRIGVALIALAALFKCAQLPFHGWLIQVMEAPTPVSALLHAGVVNLGGFVLLRIAPLVDRAVETRVMLVVVGASTAVIAAAVMTTRVSVKVALAWSTCAQMGFMVMQCGLGLWPMALLHLLAHSLYKAHAFLGAGGTVRQTQRRQLLAEDSRPSLWSVAASTIVAVIAVIAVSGAWTLLPSTQPPSATLWVVVGIVALAIVPLTQVRSDRTGRRVAFPLTAVVIAVAYLALHEMFERLVPSGPDAPIAALVIVAFAFTVLFAFQVARTVAPEHRFLARLRPWVYGAFFLDEAFTRLVFALWAPPVPTARPVALPSPQSAAAIPGASILTGHRPVATGS